MKKSLKLKTVKLIAVFSFSFFMFSCGTAPVAETKIPETDATADAAAEPAAEAQDKPAQTVQEEDNAEQPAEETLAQPAQEEETASQSAESAAAEENAADGGAADSVEAESTADNAETDNNIEEKVEEPIEETESQEEQLEDEAEVIEPKYELIEDVPGYYESEPEPVYLEQSEKVPEQEVLPAEITEEAKEEPPAEEEKENIAQAETADTKAELAKDSYPDNKEEAVKTPEAEVPADNADNKGNAGKAADTAATIENNNQKPAVVIEEIPVVAPAEVPAENKTEETEGIAAAEEVESADSITYTREEENLEEQKEAAPEEDRIVTAPSRSVEMKNNQYLDIVYPGSGWIYLGEENNKTLMRYFGRKIGEKNTVFSLRSRAEGSTILHFYKNDQLTGKVIDDYLQVEIKGVNNSPEHAVAPAYAEVIPPKPEKKVLTETVQQQDNATYIPVKTAEKKAAAKASGTSKATEENTAASVLPATGTPAINYVAENAMDSGSKTVIQNTTAENEGISPAETAKNIIQESSAAPAPASSANVNTENPEDLMADEILAKAKESFKNKKFEDTLTYLDDFFTKATTNIDEGLMLQGQTFESTSSVRNIKSALDTYETIVRRFPQSNYWTKANERMTYIKKFYFNIR